MDPDAPQFLTASIEDLEAAMEMSTNPVAANRRHAVLLLEDALEHLFYQKLCLMGVDVYRDGQNTIGLNGAIERLAEKDVEVLFLEAVRRVQKLRGDAKHHAQVPSENEFASVVQRCLVLCSAFIYENFWEDLGHAVFGLGLLPYEECLYVHSSAVRSHREELACRQMLSACVHRLQACGGRRELIRTWRAGSPSHLMGMLTSTANRHLSALGPGVGPVARPLLRDAGRGVTKGDWSGVYHSASELYCVLRAHPSVFDKRAALKVTENLYVPKAWNLEGSESWSAGRTGDTGAFKDVQRRVSDLLTAHREVIIPPRPYSATTDQEVEGPLLAVFDGDAWHPVCLSEGFLLAPECAILRGARAAEVRERVMRVAYAELRKACRVAGGEEDGVVQ